MKLGDNKIRWVDADWDCGALNLFARDTLNVDDKLFAIDGCDFALSALEFSARNEHFIVFPDGHGSNQILLAQLLGESRAHQLLA